MSNYLLQQAEHFAWGDGSGKPDSSSTALALAAIVIAQQLIRIADAQDRLAKVTAPVAPTTLADPSPLTCPPKPHYCGGFVVRWFTLAKSWEVIEIATGWRVAVSDDRDWLLSQARHWQARRAAARREGAAS